jgi:type II secretory ATPase GspE/PulE/Tfp pilus assembly ATPase PilB-like protein
VQAALTGHLVLSTLHTNNAPGAFIRLADMGVERYLLASAFNGVVAQRLARTICPYCRTSYYPPDSALDRRRLAGPDRPRLLQGRGLQAVPRQRLPRARRHLRGARGHRRRAAVRAPRPARGRDQGNGPGGGWLPLRDEGLQLVEDERSTLEEVLRVTHAETEGRTRAEATPAEIVKD